MIDWTKAVEFFDGTRAEVLKVFEDEKVVIVTWLEPESSGGGRRAMPYRMNESPLRNVPPDPREWWVRGGRLFGEKAYAEQYAVAAELIHVREVLE